MERSFFFKFLSIVLGIRMACLHLDKHQYPLCRACETGLRKMATVGFYEEKEEIRHFRTTSSGVPFSHRNIKVISYACDEHVMTVRLRLESILKKYIENYNKKPKWRFFTW